MALLVEILKFLPRKDQAIIIFKIDFESHSKILSLLSAVIGRYLDIVQNADVGEVISSVFGEGRELKQYVLSHLNCGN